MARVWVSMLSYLSVMASETVNERPHSHIGVEKSKVNSLFDTGSDLTLMNWATYLRIRIPGMKLEQSNTIIKTASGEILTVRGQVNLEYKINRHQCVRPTVIVQGLKHDSIIGADTMGSEGVILDFQKRQIIIKPSSNSFQVFTCKSVTLPGRSEREVHCSVVSDGTPLLGRDIIVTEDLEGGDVQQQIEVLESIHRVDDDSKVVLLISNVGDRPVVFNTGTRVGISHSMSGLEQRRISETVVVTDKKTISPSDVNLNGIPPELRGSYLDLIKDFSDVFAINPDDVGCCDVIKHRITLKDPQKVASTPPYRTPEHLKPVVTEYVEKLLRAGIIRPSTSPFSSPLLLVRKPGADPKKPLVEQYRVVHDYRRVNSNTVRDSYPLQNLYQLIDDVAAASVWTVVDLSSGFWNQLLTEDSCEKTAFSIPSMGVFEYLRSAQGLMNSSANFQRLIDHVIRGLKRCHGYIDDVLVASEDHNQHRKDLEELFSRFRRYNLKIRLSKLQLGARNITYLGYNLSKLNGIRAGEAKTVAVRNWTPPTTVKEVKQFLGLCSFFRRTINGFSAIAQPLTKLTRKDSAWKEGQLSADALKAFVQLRAALCARPALKPVDFSKEFILTCDASTLNGLGAILSQKHGDIEFPCAYASRTLSKPETNYAPFQLEKMAVLWAMKHFRPYLVGKHFRVRTDHKPLVGLNRIQGQQMQRVQAEMEDFQPFTIEYIPGEKNPSDGLSRLGQLCTVPAIQPRSSSESADSAESAEELVWRGKASEDKVANYLTFDQLRSLQMADKQLKAIVCKLKFDILPDDEKLKSLVKKHQENTIMIKGVLCYSLPTHLQNEERPKWLVFAPEGIKENLRTLSHDNPLAGHYGPEKTLARLQLNWFWPNMKEEITSYCRSCVTCQKANPDVNNSPTPLEKMPLVTRFGERVHMDLLGPLPISGLKRSKYLLVMTDSFTNLMGLAPLPDKTSDNVAQAVIDNWVCHHGVPEACQTDLGSEFSSKVFNEMCVKLQMPHPTSSRAHAQSNAKVERQNRVIIAYYRKYLETNPLWESLLPAIQFSYNSSAHIGTGYTPFFKAFMRRPKVPSSLQLEHISYSELNTPQSMALYARVNNQLQQLQEIAFTRQKSAFDKRAKDRTFLLGDKVFIRRAHSGPLFQKFQNPWDGPFLIVEVKRHNNYSLWKEGSRKRVNVHANNIKLASYVEQRHDSLLVTRPESRPNDLQTTPPPPPPPHRQRAEDQLRANLNKTHQATRDDDSARDDDDDDENMQHQVVNDEVEANDDAQDFFDADDHSGGDDGSGASGDDGGAAHATMRLPPEQEEEEEEEEEGDEEEEDDDKNLQEQGPDSSTDDGGAKHDATRQRGKSRDADDKKKMAKDDKKKRAKPTPAPRTPKDMGATPKRPMAKIGIDPTLIPPPPTAARRGSRQRTKTKRLLDEL
jgi:hypothetical protein